MKIYRHSNIDDDKIGQALGAISLWGCPGDNEKLDCFGVLLFPRMISICQRLGCALA